MSTKTLTKNVLGYVSDQMVVTLMLIYWLALAFDRQDLEVFETDLNWYIGAFGSVALFALWLTYTQVFLPQRADYRKKIAGKTVFAKVRKLGWRVLSLVWSVRLPRLFDSEADLANEVETHEAGFDVNKVKKNVAKQIKDLRHLRKDDDMVSSTFDRIAANEDQAEDEPLELETPEEGNQPGSSQVIILSDFPDAPRPDDLIRSRFGNQFQ